MGVTYLVSLGWSRLQSWMLFLFLIWWKLIVLVLYYYLAWTSIHHVFLSEVIHATILNCLQIVLVHDILIYFFLFILVISLFPLGIVVFVLGNYIWCYNRLLTASLIKILLKGLVTMCFLAIDNLWFAEIKITS